MKKKLFSCFAVALLLLGSCVQEKDLYVEEPDAEGVNSPDFVTVKDLTLKLSYQNQGIKANVYFEVYDENPIEFTEYSYVKKEGVEPLYANFTNEEGVFDQVITALPAYLKTVYIYTPVFYAQTLIEAQVNNGVAVAADTKIEDAETRSAGTRAGGKYDTEAVTKYGWHAWLGSYWTGEKSYGWNGKLSGEVDYVYTGSELKEADYSFLYAAHGQVIDVTKKCPEEYRSSTDMYVEKDAEVAVTLLGGNTCWNSSMGYYYYKGEKPASLDKANVILIFPNTQSGNWVNNPSASNKTAGTEKGTSVQLMYYPEIANGSMQNATNVFPKGYRIGFVLATNAWTNRCKTGNNKYFAATSDGLSSNQDIPYAGPRTAVYKYINKKQDIEAVMISFEDHFNDENFSDVVFSLKSNPVDAITDIPVVEDEKTTSTALKGVYAFEDLWPAKGDYDMNDVMVLNKYEKVFNTHGIYQESFIFKTFANFAINNNGLGFTLIGGKTGATITYSMKKEGDSGFTEAQFTNETNGTENVFLLTDNVKKNMNAEYKVTLNYGDSPLATTSESSVKPFIFKAGTDGKRWEVHIAKEHPTSKVDGSYFGDGDDRSKPNEGLYYVRDGNYPFAFFLSGATETNVAKLLDEQNEATPIDELYPDFLEWAKSNGSLKNDWYK